MKHKTQSHLTEKYWSGLRLHYDEINLKRTFHYRPSDVKKAYKLLCDKRINVSSLISGCYPLRQTQKAFERLAKGTGIKYVTPPEFIPQALDMVELIGIEPTTS
jgi:hypothetical protein